MQPDTLLSTSAALLAARCAALMLAGTVSVSAAECLQISDSTTEKVDSGYSVTTVEWSADIHNACDAPYDGTLTIRLLDTDGQVLYEAVQIVVVEGGGGESVSRRINLPSDQFELMEKVDVVITERERPR